MAERSASMERFLSSLHEDPVHRDWDVTPLPDTRGEAGGIQRSFPKAPLFLGPARNDDRTSPTRLQSSVRLMRVPCFLAHLLAP